MAPPGSEADARPIVQWPHLFPSRMINAVRRLCVGTARNSTIPAATGASASLPSSGRRVAGSLRCAFGHDADQSNGRAANGRKPQRSYDAPRDCRSTDPLGGHHHQQIPGEQDSCRVSSIIPSPTPGTHRTSMARSATTAAGPTCRSFWLHGPLGTLILLPPFGPSHPPALPNMRARLDWNHSVGVHMPRTSSTRASMRNPRAIGPATARQGFETSCCGTAHVIRCRSRRPISILDPAGPRAHP
jgi:hypothetical protein